MNIELLHQEFDKQVNQLRNKSYPDSIFKDILPLKNKLDNIKLPEIDMEKGILPFVIVISRTVMSIEEQMDKIMRNDKKGITKLSPLTSLDFHTLKNIQVPETHAYLLLDIDRGKETLNIRPEDAFTLITSQNRFPLTIEEGIAIVTQYPDFLMKNNCFSLLASRHPGDQKVPAIWINGAKNPNLGWCWDRNPHTWLGSASAKLRM